MEEGIKKDWPEEDWEEKDTAINFEEWLVLEMCKMYSLFHVTLPSTNHTHSPTETVGRGENNIKQDISDTVKTVHIVQNVLLPTVRKVQEGGGQLSSAELRKILVLRLICAVESL